MLLIQGLWVKRKTPRLPEPVMDHSGTTGSGPKLNLLLLGDSSAAGVGAYKAEDTLLGQLIKLLSKDYQLHYQMSAATGKTTADTLSDLKAIPDQNFDVIITALGVNDVTSQLPNKLWHEQQVNLITSLKQKFKPKLIIMSGLPPVGDFPALPWPLNSYLGAYANELNQILIELIETQNSVIFHSLRNYPVDALPATDGFHPGPMVYQLWAEYLTEIINMSSFD